MSSDNSSIDDTSKTNTNDKQKQNIIKKYKILREELKQINAKLLRLYTVLRKDSAVPEEDLNSSILSLTMETSFSLLNKKVLNLSLYSNAIVNRIVSQKECSEEIHSTVMDLLLNLRNVNEKALSLSAEREELFNEKIIVTLKYLNALRDYNTFLEEMKKLENETLETTNPKLAAEKKQNYDRVRKINTMKKLITELIAASWQNIEKHNEFREALLEHSKLVSLDDFQHVEIEP